MKYIFLLLLGVGIISTVYINKDNQPFEKIFYYHPCDNPLKFRIDTVDSRFQLSKQDFITYTKESADIWNKAYKKTIFTYDPQGEISVSLLFDQRQSITNEIRSIEDELQTGRQNLDPEISTYRQRSETFEKRAASLNSQIAYWNDKGGAPPEEFDKLIKEQQELKKEADELNRIAKELNQSTDFFNSKVGKLNQTVDTFNTVLGEKPEEGIYNGNENRIEVYFYNNKNELLRTLAHELGHARGLGHLIDKTAIMYKNTTRYITPTASDLSALETVCKRRSLISLFEERFKLLINAIEI